MRALAPALTLALALIAAPPARAACGIALVLAVDVSGSVDAAEYALQTRGFEAALRDPEVVQALVAAQAAVAVVQWSGSGQQQLTIPWMRVDEPAQAARLAGRVGAAPRAFGGGNTAVGEAIDFAAALFGAPVRDCARWVIDIAGDGDENEGFTVGRARRAAAARGITINGLAIEGFGTGQSITNFYRGWVITPGGFVITARGHADFARAMRLKLLRELSPPLADRLRQLLWQATAATRGAPAGRRRGLFFRPETPMVNRRRQGADMRGGLDYGNLMHQAMRGLIREVLKQVARTGLPGAHHFFITFTTRHPGVAMADWLRRRYPDEITIVIQHWYENLEVDENGFAITLNFGNQPEPLYIPFDAITTFVDPSVEFGLKFEIHLDDDGDHDRDDEAPMEEAEPEPPRTGEVVSLDKFRK